MKYVRKRNINIIYQCIYTESRMMVPRNLFAGQCWRNAHREQTHGHGKWRGEGEINAESNMETYITTGKVGSQWEFVVSGNSNRGSFGGSESKESARNAGDPGSIPGLGRSPGEGNGNPYLKFLNWENIYTWCLYEPSSRLSLEPGNSR